MSRKKLPDETSPEWNSCFERALALIREGLESELPEGTSFEQYEEAAIEIATEIVRNRSGGSLRDQIEAGSLRA